MAPRTEWPPLPLDAWSDTLDTLHMWTQVVGKIRMMRSPLINHWWQVPLYVTPRGLGTGSIPHGTRLFDMEFDFVDHRLRVRASDGASAEVEMRPRSVASFYRELMDVLGQMDLGTAIRLGPVEVEKPIPFDVDEEHASYDGEAAHRCWQILARSACVMEEFRARFLGKSSPVHFFWGGFDLAVTRFSGDEAPEHPGGFPHMPDWVTREAYSHRVSSAGFWPGTGLGEPAYYAYAYPAPDGYAQYAVVPPAAYFHEDLGEFVLPYEAVRTSADPAGALMAFLQSTYEAAAESGGWDRSRLERDPQTLRRLHERLTLP